MVSVGRKQRILPTDSDYQRRVKQARMKGLPVPPRGLPPGWIRGMPPIACHSCGRPTGIRDELGWGRCRRCGPRTNDKVWE